MGIYDVRTPPNTPIPSDILDLIRLFYSSLDDSSKVEQFADIFTSDGTLKVAGLTFEGSKAIVEGQRHATAGGSWVHTIDSIYPFGSGEDLQWFMVNLRAEFTPGPGRKKRSLESVARIQVAREPGRKARAKFVQVYVYESKASL